LASSAFLVFFGGGGEERGLSVRDVDCRLVTSRPGQVKGRQTGVRCCVRLSVEPVEPRNFEDGKAMSLVEEDWSGICLNFSKRRGRVNNKVVQSSVDQFIVCNFRFLVFLVHSLNLNAFLCLYSVQNLILF
jgi:hypothetical protein